MILLSEMLKSGGVYVGIEAREKEAALDEILGFFCDEGKYTKNHKTKLKTAIMEREATGSTGIGNGGAIPHCRIGKDEEVELYISIAADQIEFQSIDGKPVKVVFLVILPKSNTSIHADALKAIAGLMRNERFFRYLKGAKNKTEVIEIVADYEKEIGIKK